MFKKLHTEIHTNTSSALFKAIKDLDFWERIAFILQGNGQGQEDKLGALK